MIFRLAITGIILALLARGIDVGAKIEIYEIIKSWTLRHDKHEAMHRLAAAGVPCSYVFDTVDLFMALGFGVMGYAFRKLDIPKAPLAETGYPLATLVAASGVTETRCDPRPGLSRRVSVSEISDPDTMIERIARAHAEGQAVAWVCNTVDDAIAAVLNAHGDRARGEALFQQVGCNLCHTTSPNEPPRGPILSQVATIFNRRDFAEAILLPS